MAEPLVLGVDVGTNATKCVLCTAKGDVVAQSRRDYALQHPRPGWVEQDPEELWTAVVGAVREACAGAGQSVVAMSLSCQGGTTIPVDSQMRPLRPAISWLDGRAAAEGKELVELLGQEAIYRATGWEAHAALPVLHIAWLRKHEPELFGRTARFLFVNDFILYRLTGELLMDPSDAALTLLYNVEDDRWDPQLCAAAGVRVEQLSPIAASGRVVGRLLSSAARELGLSTEVVVINGGHDQYCAALGAGVVRDGDVLLSCGTAWVLLAAASRLIRDPLHTFAPGRHVLPGVWGLLCSMPAAGAAMDWAVRNLANGPQEEELRYDRVDEHLKAAAPGAGGLLFLPLLAGVEAATRRSGQWGAITGLALGHSRWDMLQSLMEGVALELRWILQRLQELGQLPQELRMVGGATRSTIWPQIVANASGLPLTVPQVSEAASRGAAMLAALGAVLCQEVWADSGQARTIRPVPEHVLFYAELFARFQATFEALYSVSCQSSKQ
jgi:xylulokinase